MYVCGQTGVAVQRGLGLFCLLGKERNAQIKHSEQDALIERKRERETGHRDAESSRQKELTKERRRETPERNRARD